MANKKIYVSVEMAILELGDKSVLSESTPDLLGVKADNDSPWEWGDDAV